MEQPINRREFVVAAVATAACLCSMGDGQTVPSTGSATTAPTTLDVGPKSDYATDGITATWMKAPNKVAVIRHGGRIYACTTICTHKHCTVAKAPNGEGFICPCHHATYDIEGNVTHRPAKFPLDHYAISVDDNGHLIVNKTQSFTADQWDDPASFVKAD